MCRQVPSRRRRRVKDVSENRPRTCFARRILSTKVTLLKARRQRIVSMIVLAPLDRSTVSMCVLQRIKLRIFPDQHRKRQVAVT